jgi:hypothetical protein
MAVVTWLTQDILKMFRTFLEAVINLFKAY